MSITLKREKLYEDAITFPATADAVAVTGFSLSSNVFSDFSESGIAAVDLSLSAEKAAEVINTLTFQGYASFDEGTTWLKTSNGAASYTDITNTAGTAEVVTGVFTGATAGAYEDKYFVIYDGTTPYFCWYYHDAGDTRPVTGVAEYDNAIGIKMDVSTGVSLDTIGELAHEAINAAATGVFTTTWTTDTLVITSVNKHACKSAYAGNLRAITSVATSFGTTTAGVDASAVKQIALAPYFKVVATFDTNGALHAGHGLKVDVKMKELDTDYRKKIFSNVVPTLTSTTDALAATYPEFTGTTLYTDGLDAIKKAYVAFYCADTSKFENNLDYAIETSDDGVNWRNAIAPITSFDKSTGVYYVVTECVTDSNYRLGEYLRVRVYGGVGAALTSGHGIKANVVLCY